jgi:branched-chain amino acid transport system permease protein
VVDRSLVAHELTSTVSAPSEPASEEIVRTSFARRWLGGVHPGYLGLLAVLAVYPWVLVPLDARYPLSLATGILVLSIFTMSLDLMLGYAGLFSFGHAAFLGIGGYTAAILSVRLGISNLGITLAVAIVLASIGALVLGLLALRTSGVYFLMLTLAFAQIVSAAVSKWGPVTGGTNGLPGVQSPDLFVPGWTVGDGMPFYYLTLTAAALTFFLLFRIIHSPFGRSLIGIHQNERRMRAMGYDVRLYKLVAFWIGGMFAALSGVLYADFNHFISPDATGFAQSGTAVIMVLLGGEGTLIGPVFGTVAYMLIQNSLSSFTPHWQLVLGILFVVFVMFVRGGLAGIWSRIRTRLQPHGAA